MDWARQSNMWASENFTSVSQTEPQEVSDSLTLPSMVLGIRWWNGRALRQCSITGRYSRHPGRGCGTSPSIKLTQPPWVKNCINRLPRQAGAGSWSNGLKCTLVSVGTSVILRIHHIMPRREKKRSNHEARKPRGRYGAGLAEKLPLMR